MSDEAPVCPKMKAEEACKPPCKSFFEEYQKCAERIEGKPGKHCQGYYLEYLNCIDKCATPYYWPDLK